MTWSFASSWRSACDADRAAAGPGAGRLWWRPAAAGHPCPRQGWAATQWAGVTLADLEEGRRLYRAKCSGCHLPVAPADVTRAAWPGHVAEMRERAHLEPTQVTLIERYLVTLAER